MRGGNLKIQIDCLPCYVNQAMEAADYAGMDREGRWQTLQEVCRELSEVDRSYPSARVGQKVHKIVRDNADTSDPYRKQKELSNDVARKYREEFRKLALESENPLERAARLATAGNAVDFGPDREFDIESALRCGYEEEFVINDWPQFRSSLRGANDLLYFTDNSGEIIYDILFVELLLDRTGLEELDLVVKDGPFLNDVTESDLAELSIGRLENVGVRTIDNGDGGSSPALWSDEVEGWLDRYDLVVSKGQANYEGLSEYDKPNLFFFLTVKCDLVATEVGAEEGSKVLLRAVTST
ncbi:MAG: damage-control phosphatase ARMT1 family protein [Candidatus Bipolaricaulota bacterium]